MIYTVKLKVRADGFIYIVKVENSGLKIKGEK